MGTYDNAGGWIDQPAVPDEDINDQDLKNLRVKGLWNPGDALKINATATIHRNSTGALPSGEDENGNYTQPFQLLTTPSSQEDYELYNATLIYDFEKVSFLSASSYIDSDRLTKDYGQVFQFFPIPFPPINAWVEQQGISTKVFTEEVRLNSRGKDSWQWTVGAFYRNAQSTQFSTGFLTGLPGPLPTRTPTPFLRKEDSESWAIFGTTSFDVTERTEVGIGLRYFEDDQKLFDGATTQIGTFDSLSPRAYLNFDINNDVMAYASVAKGFRSGGFNALGQPSYEPESVWSYELGTKMTSWNGRIQAELAIFYSDYSDYQILGVLPPPAPFIGILSNAGDAEIKGVDWAITLQPADNISFVFNGTYVDATFVNINALSASYSVDDRVPLVPKYQVALSGIYDFVLKDMPGNIRLDYNQQGKSFFANRTFGDHFHDTSDVIDMLNLNVSWQFNKQISFGLFARNLLDDRGFLNAKRIFGEEVRPRPRTVGFELGLRY